MGDFLAIPILGVNRLQFKCGSIIGSGVMNLPNDVTQDSNKISTDFNNAVQNNAIPEITRYGVAGLDITGKNYC